MKYFLKIFVNFFEITLIAAGVLLLSYVFLGQLLEVSGESMYPTIKDKEQIVAEKLTIKYQDLKRGDVVIISHPKEPGVLLVKRIIGLPNEEIMIRDGNVFINGKVIEEPYLQPNTKTIGGITLREGIEYQLAPDAYMVLGDNREKSTDSRYWGALPKQNVIGKAFFIYYPLKQMGFIR